MKDAQWVSTLNVKSLAELRALTTQAILDAAKKPGVGFPPNIDGKVLTEAVADTYKAGKQAHVPLLAGWNADEGSFFAMRGMTAVQWKAMAGKLFKEKSVEFLKLYPAARRCAERSVLLSTSAAISLIAFSTWSWLEAHRATGNAPVYRYHFELAATPS